ncbi:helix-turn-helix domain-containing protein [Enterococcus innesii]|uniref:helix-turn-helix domain-containing protein n=1 Tax=Enterococcus innesii TaxID=2839759 RepID=UPI003984F9AA
MGLLLTQLIYQVKTKRWLTIMNQLEEHQTMTALELAEKTRFTERTIRSDIKEMKLYFESSIVLIGGDTGYHFSFHSPVHYMKKKQALLDNEPLFILIDQLVEGQCLTNQEWAEKLLVSTASFARIKRRLVQVLKEHYQVAIVSRLNQLQGSEAAIRQLMYDFYFTLALYPKEIEKKVNQLSLCPSSARFGKWQLDSLRLNQWGYVVHKRITQGNTLPINEGYEESQQKLAQVLDEGIKTSFPAQEKAALVLLTLNEDQFLNPLRQVEFIHQFSLHPREKALIQEAEHRVDHFFEEMISLMHAFFQLPSHRGAENRLVDQSEETLFFNQMMKVYVENKKQIEQSLFVQFDLMGSMALQEWIKRQVRRYVQEAGYCLLDGTTKSACLQQVTITNKSLVLGSTSVCLSKIPETREIQQALASWMSHFSK